jgi:hypothetical protein
MKKTVSVLIVSIIVLGLAVSGCQKKSNAEKSMDKLQKDASGILK